MNISLTSQILAIGVIISKIKTLGKPLHLNSTQLELLSRQLDAARDTLIRQQKDGRR